MQNATGPSSTGSVPSSSGSVPANGTGSAGLSLAGASFAGLMAKLAVPQKGDPSWNDDELADDVATISYERAIRTDVRSNPTPSPGPCPAKSGDGAGSGHRKGSADGAKPLKTASITIRLSDSECAQLRRRAAEAGLTISAYLRSCTLEVESLRAQVKETLAELRNSAPKPCGPETKPESARRIRSFFAALRHRFKVMGRRKALAVGLNASNPFAPVG